VFSVISVRGFWDRIQRIAIGAFFLIARQVFRPGNSVNGINANISVATQRQKCYLTLLFLLVTIKLDLCVQHIFRAKEGK
jgi:hypothetical protein